MTTNGVVNPGELANLTRLLDDHCRERGIIDGDPMRRELAHLLMTMFNNGFRDEGSIKRALQANSDSFLA